MKVLHIEDNESDSFFIKRLLAAHFSDLDYKLVEDLDEFKTSLNDFQPDVVISDHKLKGFTSKEVYVAFKDSWQKCPFILVTNAISEEFAVETLRNGVDDYILKDRLERLPKSIENLLAKYQWVAEKDEYIKQIIESEIRYKDLLHSTSELIHSADENGNILFVNESWKRVLGYTLREVLAKNIFDFLENNSKISCLSKFQRIMKGEKVENMRLKMISKDGSVKILEGMGVPRLLGNDVIGSHAFFKDVTEKENIQSELEKSEKRYALAIDATADGIIDFNIKENSFYLSVHSFDILNQNNRQISLSNLSEIIPPSFYQWIKGLLESDNNLQKKLSFDQDIQLNINSDKWINIKAGFNPSDFRINGSIRDITDKKIQEIEIQNLNKELEQKVEIRTLELKSAIKLLTHKNKEIQDSIVYAKRIHNALLTIPVDFSELFPNSFIINQPKELIGGDFAWYQQLDDCKFVAAVDCTGHGVPGALLSVVATILLDEAVSKQKIINPSEILGFVNNRLNILFRNSSEVISDGMDIALCTICEKENLVLFSGAQRPMYQESNGVITKRLGDKISLGQTETQKSFAVQEIKYLPGDMLYLFSDGITSQFGGPEGKKIRRQQFMEELESISGKPNKQELITDFFEKWKGDMEQTDDVLILGIKLNKAVI